MPLFSYLVEGFWTMMALLPNKCWNPPTSSGRNRWRCILAIIRTIIRPCRSGNSSFVTAAIPLCPRTAGTHFLGELRGKVQQVIADNEKLEKEKEKLGYR